VSGFVPIYFQVPFADKAAAKAMGARWNHDLKVWFAPSPDVASAMRLRWREIAEVEPITILPGEDRLFGSGLFVDLIPRSCWFTNVRSCIAPEDWTRLSVGIRQRAGNRCEICSADGIMEAHERWDYRPDGTQVLKRLVSVCSPCHQVTHFGLSQLRGLEEECAAHWAQVNPGVDFDAHVEQAFALWAVRNRRAWALDLSIIEQAGLTIVRPVAAADRRAIADHKLTGHGR
jgi:hypothetical protein